MSKKISLFICCLAFSMACTSPLPHYEVKGEILLNDDVYLSITADFIVETPEALKEVRIKSDQLAFAIRIALREHSSKELKGMGKRNVLNALKSISRQLLEHPVKEVHIIDYDFHKAPHNFPI